tara:strand:- start:1 stop:666 length:666 start_codon:yes stop_codon:yes gene_type:complete
VSKIFVDQVDPRTATTLTLGTTGDTVSIPTGVTLSGAGTITASAANLAASGAGGVTGTLPIANGGTGAATLAAAGLSNTPAMYAKLTSDQAVSNNTLTVAALATEILDSDGTFDNSNYRWTPGVAGYYLIVGSIYFGGIGDNEQIQAYLTVNGNILNHNNLYHGLAQASPGADRSLIDSITTVIYLDADDYVDWRIKQASGGTVNAEADWTYMAGFRITGV